MGKYGAPVEMDGVVAPSTTASHRRTASEGPHERLCAGDSGSRLLLCVEYHNGARKMEAGGRGESLIETTPIIAQGPPLHLLRRSSIKSCWLEGLLRALPIVHFIIAICSSCEAGLFRCLYSRQNISRECGT